MRYARVVELVDSLDSGSSAHSGRGGSTPPSRTMKKEGLPNGSPSFFSEVCLEAREVHFVREVMLCIVKCQRSWLAHFASLRAKHETSRRHRRCFTWAQPKLHQKSPPRKRRGFFHSVGAVVSAGAVAVSVGAGILSEGRSWRNWLKSMDCSRSMMHQSPSLFRR